VRGPGGGSREALDQHPVGIMHGVAGIGGELVGARFRAMIGGG